VSGYRFDLRSAEEEPEVRDDWPERGGTAKRASDRRIALERVAFSMDRPLADGELLTDYRLLVLVKVDDALDVVSFVDQADVAADGDVPLVPRRMGELAYEISRRRVHLPPEILVEDRTFMEARLFVRGKPVLIPQAYRCVVPVLGIPIPGDLLVVIVKLSVFSPVLSERERARENERRRRRNCHPAFSHR
jgi:hypothetical protein